MQGGQTLAMDTGTHPHSPTRSLSEEPCCGRGRAYFYSDELISSYSKVLAFCPLCRYEEGARGSMGGSLIAQLWWGQGRVCPLLAPASMQSSYSTTWHVPFQRSFYLDRPLSAQGLDEDVVGLY